MGSPGSDGSRRALCLGVSDFGTDPTDKVEPALTRFAGLPFAHGLVQELREELAALGYALVDEPCGDVGGLHAKRLGEAVHGLISAATSEDVLVVHVLSHGEADGAFGLTVIGADGYAHETTTVDGWLAKVEKFSARPYTLFLLDMCGAGAASRLQWLGPQAGGKDNRAWVIAATGADDPAWGGRFTRAVTQVLGQLRAAEIDLDPQRQYVPFGTLIELVRRMVFNLAEGDLGRHQHVTATPIVGEYPELPFVPNPAFVPDPARSAVAKVDVAVVPVLDAVLDAPHFQDRAAGHRQVGSIAWGCFAGRAQELRRLSAWLDGTSPDELAVVTGSPGAGKSALLGVLVCAAHPRLRDPTRPLWRHTAHHPAPNPQLAVVHAQQRSLTELVGSLARQLHLDTKTSTADELITALAARPEPVVLVLDALDEALVPIEVMTGLLLPLARATRPDGRGMARLLVGMRPWPEFAPLQTAATETIDLDLVDSDRLHVELTQYVTDLLELYPTTADLDLAHGRTAFATTLATTLAAAHTTARQQPTEQRWGAFLVAALFTHSLTTGPAERLRDPVIAAGLGEQAPVTLPEVLELDLTNRPASRWRRPVLAALARAHGAGLPRHLLHGTAAAVAGTTTGPTDDELTAVLEEMRFYLRASSDTDAVRLYRLFHQGLTDHLCAHPTDPQSLAPADLPGRILDQLLAGITTPDGTRRWDLAGPYLHRHAIQHAGEAHQADDLLADPEFLVHADPATLTPRLDYADSEEAVLAATVYRTSAGRRTADPGGRREVLTIDAARYGSPQLVAALTHPPHQPPLPWQPAWATGGQISPALRATLTGHTGWVLVVACTQLDGRSVAVTGSTDKTVRVWDLITGLPLGAPLTGHTSNVSAVACTEMNGRLVAVTGSSDNTIQIWDLTTGHQVDQLLTGHTNGVNAVACTELDGRPVAVTTSADGAVQVWDLANRCLYDVALSGHTTFADAVACTELDGRPVAVTTGHDKAVRVWDLHTGRHIGRPLIGPVCRAVACTRLDGRPVAVTGSDDNTVRIWDLATGRQVGQPLTGHTNGVNAVACTELDGRPVAVTGSGDNTVRLWDLRTGRQVGQPLTGHTDRVRAIACARRDGRPVAVTTSWDDTLRIWDLTANRLIGNPVINIDLGVTRAREQPVVVTDKFLGKITILNSQKIDHVACAKLGDQPVVVASGFNTVHVCELHSGHPIGKPFTTGRPYGTITAVDCAQLEDQPVAVITTGSGLVQVWELGTGRQHCQFSHTGRIDAVACTRLNGRPVAVTGCQDNSVRLWDLRTGQPVGRPCTGHTDQVFAVSCTRLDDRPVAVSVSLDATMRIWDLHAGHQIGDPVSYRAPHERTAWRAAVACTQLDGRSVAVITGWDHTLSVWHLAERRSAGVIHLPHRAEAVAMADPGLMVLGMGWDVVVLRLDAARLVNP